MASTRGDEEVNFQQQLECQTPVTVMSQIDLVLSVLERGSDIASSVSRSASKEADGSVSQTPAKMQSHVSESQKNRKEIDIKTAVSGNEHRQKSRGSKGTRLVIVFRQNVHLKMRFCVTANVG